MSSLTQVLPTFETAKGERSRGAGTPAFAPDSRAKAEERAFANGMAAAREEYEAKLAEAAADFERRLAAERTRWSEEESARLADDLKMALCALEARLSNDMAGVLLPLIDAMLAAKAVSGIEQAVRSIVSRQEQPVIKVRGRDDLMQALKSRLGDVGATFEVSPEDDASGVSLEVGDTLIEAELRNWSERLSQSIGEGGHG